MVKFSANLGFLWTDRPLADAIRAAEAAGFDAVECHFPYDQPAEDVKAALADTGLPILALNTVRGDVDAGDFGLCALPGREDEARAAIDQAVAYGAEIGAGAVHMMSGKSWGMEGAEAAFRANLDHACAAAAAQDMSVLIEPINHRDAPNYWLHGVEQAAEVLESAGHANAAIMFDCYHTQIMQGDLIKRLEAHMDRIGHVQIAGVPDRAEPDRGEVNYVEVLRALEGLGYTGYVGAEYRPAGTVEAGLGWLSAFRDALT